MHSAQCKEIGRVHSVRCKELGRVHSVRCKEVHSPIVGRGVGRCYRAAAYRHSDHCHSIHMYVHCTCKLYNVYVPVYCTCTLYMYLYLYLYTVPVHCTSVLYTMAVPER